MFHKTSTEKKRCVLCNRALDGHCLTCGLLASLRSIAPFRPVVAALHARKTLIGFFFSVELRLIAGNDLLILEVGLIWTSDQLVASLTRVKHPCPGGIRTLNLSRRAAADPRLRPLGHQGPSDCYDATLK